MKKLLVISMAVLLYSGLAFAGVKNKELSALKI